MKASKKQPSGNTKKKAVEKAPDSDKSLTLFREATSQELATTLGVLVGELDFALSTDNVDSRARSTSVAVGAAEHALSLARNLRFFSVHTKMNFQGVDLSQIVLDSVELIEKELELSQVKITVMAEASTYTQADPDAIQQVILNLLAHSRRSISKGGKITLSLRQNPASIEIRCTDTGPALPERDLEQAFEHGAPSSEAITDDKSEALELTVCRMLVTAHGGELTTQTRTGMGNTVSVILPFDAKTKKPVSISEERRFRRIPIRLPVEIFLSRGQTTLKTELTTLSVGGCFTRISDLQTSQLPELNDTVSLRIRYFGHEVLAVTRGRIASVSWAGVNSGIGIEFIDFDTRTRKLLEAIVKSHSA